MSFEEETGAGTCFLRIQFRPWSAGQVDREIEIAELFGSRAGLGRLISQSADAFNMPELFAGVIVLAVAGIAMTAGFGWLEKRLVPWTKD